MAGLAEMKAKVIFLPAEVIAIAERLWLLQKSLCQGQSLGGEGFCRAMAEVLATAAEVVLWQ